jgi:hypothetical protein
MPLEIAPRNSNHIPGGGGEQRRWHGETEFLSGLEINDEIEVGRLLDQETARLGVHPTRIKGLLPALPIAYGRGA